MMVCLKEYQVYVSEFGEVWDLSGRERRITATYPGYLTVAVKVDGKFKKLSVHRLVALAYLSNPHNKPMVNHLDGDKANAYYKNLEWCTAKENSQHASKVLGCYKANYKYGAAKWYANQYHNSL